jgi:hypothetical protein
LPVRRSSSSIIERKVTTSSLFVFGSHMLQNFVPVTFKVRTFPQNFVRCCEQIPGPENREYGRRD